MRIGIIGTGRVGQALARGFAAAGHDVRVGTRDVQATRSRAEFADIPALATFAEAAEHGEIVVNATKGSVSLDALALIGADRLSGRILLDVANALDFSAGGVLFVSDKDSLAERIQRAYPQARVVKSLNTVNASVMVNPEALGGGEHTIFVCGNDDAAKGSVTQLLRSVGWRDIIDLGDLSAARALEMTMPIWLRLMNALGTATFNYRIVR